MNPRILIGLSILVLGTLGTVWFFNNFDYVDYRQWVGLRGEARRNPYLAAQRLMVELGTPADELRSVSGINRLPPKGVLVIGEAREILTPNGRKALLDWVAHGGYLITEDLSAEKSDALLDAFEVSREAIDEDEREREWPLVEFEFPDREQTLKAQMHEWQSIEREDSLLYARSENANHVLHFRYGDGYVTVLNSMWFMENRALGKHDHAEILYALLELAPVRSAISFFNEPEDLSLWDWLAENAWTVLCAGALALTLWLWRIGPRFGPIAPDPQRERRSLLEHLRACGRFEWRAQGGPQLLEAARDVTWRRIARAHPELAGLSKAETITYLARRFDLHEEDAKRLLMAGGATNENQFIQRIQIYQRVQEKLQPQTKSLPGEQV
ncbi:MAG TPA: DUF4350 domain-containing protein [Burkholderiales bacterium]|nr:DUF4350 domain-containing protein [Burkholderiales bacterium]